MNNYLIIKTLVKNIVSGFGILSILSLHPVWASEHLSGFDCLIEPNSISEVGTGESGVIENFLVDRGDVIEKGQVLARLESRVEELAVELARARAEVEARQESGRMNVEYLERQLQRIGDLVNREALPSQEKDRAETELALAKYQLQESTENMQIAQIELKRATEALARRTIRSPINGVVMERLLAVGEIVDERPIIKVAEIVPLSVSVIMPIDFYNAIDIGMMAEIKPWLSESGPREATVVMVDAVVDAASNTFGVRLELPNEDLSIPGGIRCDVRFISE
jgi:RND family efflux transporter MFP subunit